MASLGLMEFVIPVTRPHGQLFWLRSKTKTIQCSVSISSHTQTCRSVTVGQAYRTLCHSLTTVRSEISWTCCSFCLAILMKISLPGSCTVSLWKSTQGKMSICKLLTFRTCFSEEFHRSYMTWRYAFQCLFGTWLSTTFIWWPLVLSLGSKIDLLLPIYLFYASHDSVDLVLSQQLYHRGFNVPKH